MLQIYYTWYILSHFKKMSLFYIGLYILNNILKSQQGILVNWSIGFDKKHFQTDSWI